VLVLACVAVQAHDEGRWPSRKLDVTTYIWVMPARARLSPSPSHWFRRRSGPISSHTMAPLSMTPSAT
jgi:hypothetical protein